MNPALFLQKPTVKSVTIPPLQSQQYPDDELQFFFMILPLHIAPIVIWNFLEKHMPKSFQLMAFSVSTNELLMHFVPKKPSTKMK